MTQNEMVLEYLKEHKGITTLDAFREFGITRLSGRIFNLREQGYKIKSVDLIGKNRYGKSVRYTRYELHEG